MSCDSWWYRHRLALDGAQALSFAVFDTAMTLLGGSWWPSHPTPAAWVMLGVQAVACLSLTAWRRAPLTVLAIMGGFTLAVTLLISPAGVITPAHPNNVWAPYATVLAAYGPVFFRRDRRTALIAIGVLTLIVARPWQPSLVVITVGVARTVIGPLLALYISARRALVQALKDRAERAEREQHLLAEQARAEERGRLAGEMHDVVTHRVSLMVLQAGALRMTATDEVTRQAAEELRTAGCQALDELRDLVGILRSSPDGEQSPPAAGLAALVAESTGVGTPTELTEDGDPALASPVVGRTVYRVVREALTNVRKHAPGARVAVQVSYDPAQVHVSIRNTHSAGYPASPLAGTGSGLGLANLRQRIELVHGTLLAGPGPDGGFQVEATLPAYVPTLDAVAADAPAAAAPAAEPVV